MNRLKNAAFAVALLCLPSPLSAQDADADQHTALRDFIEANSYELSIEDGALAGPAASWFAETTRDVDFFMFGESHASATIANLATAMFKALEPNGFSHAAIEVDPWVGAKVEALLRDENPSAYADFMAEGTNLLTVPFYSWKEEYEFLKAVLDANGNNGPAFINLDQAFIGASQFLFEELYDLSTTEEQQAAVAIHVQKSKDAFMHLGSAEPAELILLRPLFADATNGARELVDAIILSNQIYGAFVRQSGTVVEANAIRENYMKALLTGHLKRFEREGGVPKIFFKFGANHVFRGRSPTNVWALGNFIMEYANLTLRNTFNIHVTCVEGSVRDVLSGNEAACDSYYVPTDSILISSSENSDMTMIDMRPLRTSRLIRQLDEKAQNLAWAYDAILVIRNGKPASFFDGTLPTMPQ